MLTESELICFVTTDSCHGCNYYICIGKREVGDYCLSPPTHAMGIINIICNGKRKGGDYCHVINNSVCHSVLMTALQFQLPSTVTRKANKIVMCTVLVKFLKYFLKRKKKEKKKEQEEKKRKKEEAKMYTFTYIINI